MHTRHVSVAKLGDLYAIKHGIGKRGLSLHKQLGFTAATSSKTYICLCTHGGSALPAKEPLDGTKECIAGSNPVKHQVTSP